MKRLEPEYQITARPKLPSSRQELGGRVGDVDEPEPPTLPVRLYRKKQVTWDSFADDVAE